MLKELKKARIATPFAPIMRYCADVFERLDAIGYGEFRKNNQKQMRELLLEGTRLFDLNTGIKERFKVEAGLEKNVKLFFQQALKKKQQHARRLENASTTRTKSQQQQAPAPVTKVDRTARVTKHLEAGGFNNNKEQKDLVECIHPPHKSRKIKHKLKDFRGCPEEKKPKIIEEYFKKHRKINEAKRVQTKAVVKEDDAKESSIVFQTVSANLQDIQTCFESGSNGNIMDKNALQEIICARGEVEVETLSHSRVFEMAAHVPDGKQVELVCKKEAVKDKELHIRHGSSTLLRNASWFITGQHLENTLLDRPIQQGLGLNSRALLEAATGRITGGFDDKI